MSIPARNPNNLQTLKTPILLGFGRNTAEYLTITPKHKYAPPAQNRTEHHTNKHIPPQPSTPIERAGSDCPGRYWMRYK